METATNPRTLTTTAADTLLLTLDGAAQQLRCELESLIARMRDGEGRAP